LDVFKLKIFFSGYFGEPFRAYSAPAVLGKKGGAFTLIGHFLLGNFLYTPVAGRKGKRAGLAKIVASNYSLTDGTLYPQMRKPFDLVAKGLSSSEWLPETYSATTVF